MSPGSFVIVDQFVDRTFARAKSFFGEGIVAHVSMADPVCPRLSEMVAGAARNVGIATFEGGTYLAMEGPQFSTRAESHLYRQWGADVIGMTAMPEAKLAREAELPYALVGMVTDYDCWREDGPPVEVEAVVAQLHANSAKAAMLVDQLTRSLPVERKPSPIDSVLDTAIITDPAVWDPALAAKLSAIAGRVLGSRAK
jgi:5'-methylthioadenosine phosphorylase